MAEEAPKSIIIKKVRKGGHGGHHAGAWKIAYADFVTAMMAFFLLLWLLSSVPQENLEVISNYFAPVSVSQSTSGSGGVLGGTVIAEEEGAGTASSSAAVVMELPPVTAGSGGQAPDDIIEDAARKALERAEQEQFEEAEEEIQAAIEANEDFEELKHSLRVEDTEEGLRIQLMDQDGVAMFKSGGSVMEPRALELIKLVSKVVKPLPQHLSISGHTDSVPFTTATGYGNWELSSDRANAARRELIADGLDDERVARVVGKAATEPLLPDDPAHASNRRLSIVLLRGTGEQRDAEEEVLPGLNQIKQEQLEEQRNSNGVSIELGVQ